MIARDENWFNMTCPVCGNKFHLKPCAVKRFKTHYCSKKCHYEAKREYMKGEKNHQYGLRGRANASWKSDVKNTNFGYIMIRNMEHPFCDKQGWVFEHRLVAEKFLLTDENSIELNGVRYLKPEYEVHHKNFDRKDNRVENLEILTHREHKTIHNRLNPNGRNKKGQFVKTEPEIIKVKKVSESAIVPTKQTIGSAGYDLYANINDAIEIRPHETVMIQSGLAFEIPRKYYGAIFARSGLATKQGLRPSTCVSVIDSDYRGNVGLPMHNDSDEVQLITPGERIAQIIFTPAVDVELRLVSSLSETERGENGFGSSGKF